MYLCRWQQQITITVIRTQSRTPDKAAKTSNRVKYKYSLFSSSHAVSIPEGKWIRYSINISSWVYLLVTGQMQVVLESKIERVAIRGDCKVTGRVVGVIFMFN